MWKKEKTRSIKRKEVNEQPGPGEHTGQGVNQTASEHLLTRSPTVSVKDTS
jgi:hypothetical protein